VDYNEYEIGYRSVQVLSDLARQDCLQRMQVVVCTSVVERETCGKPRRGPLRPPGG
jgi:hypothetical protein